MIYRIDTEFYIFRMRNDSGSEDLQKGGSLCLPEFPGEKKSDNKFRRFSYERTRGETMSCIVRLRLFVSRSLAPGAKTNRRRGEFKRSLWVVPIFLRGPFLHFASAHFPVPYLLSPFRRFRNSNSFGPSIPPKQAAKNGVTNAKISLSPL